MGFLEDLFGRLTPQRPPVDVFGGVEPLDAFGDLMGDGSDALPPITPFGGLDRSFGGFGGGLGSTSSMPSTFWQMPALGGGIGTTRRGAFSSPLPIKEDTLPLQPRRRAFSTQPATTTTGTTAGTTTPSSGTTATPTFSGTALPGTRDTVLRWMPLVQEMSAKYGVPAEVILASIDSESGGDPNAIGPDTGGQGRANGLLQAMPIYWGKFGNLFDPRVNLDTIVGQLMKPAWDKYQSAAHVRAVTYGGPNAIDSAGNIKGQLSDAGIPGWTISKDVARYLPKVEAYKRYLQGQSAAPQTFQTGGQWDHLVPGGQGRVESGGTHGGHPAIDIFATEGTPILSPVDGVSEPGTYPLGGNATTIRGSNGRFYYLAHARDPMRAGTIRKGDVIGYVGNTGNARGTASHLHFAVASRPDVFNIWNGSGDLDPT